MGAQHPGSQHRQVYPSGAAPALRGRCCHGPVLYISKPRPKAVTGRDRSHLSPRRGQSFPALQTTCFPLTESKRQPPGWVRGCVCGCWFLGPGGPAGARLAEEGGAHASRGEGLGPSPGRQRCGSCALLYGRIPGPRGGSGPGHTALTTQRARGRAGPRTREPLTAQGRHVGVSEAWGQP